MVTAIFKNRVLSVILLSLLCIVLAAPVAVYAASEQASAASEQASATQTSAPATASGTGTFTGDRFIDEVGLLTETEALALDKRLSEVSNAFGFDTVVAVVYELGGKSARLRAADFYEGHNFGMDSQNSGAILLLAMKDRDWGFATTGRGIEIINPDVQDYLYTLFLPYLKEDNYYKGFMAYANGVEDIITQWSMGQPYNSSNIPLSGEARSEAIGISVVASLLIALAIAAIVTGVWRGKLKSVRPQDLADEYVKPGSMALTGYSDRFLYSHVTSTPRSSDSSSGGRGFSSSSGSSFSGSSGKF